MSKMTPKPKTKEVVTYLAQPGMKPRKIFTVVTKPKPKTSWRERFDKIGFGNQARIVGAKRVELKDFISQLLIEERKKMTKQTNKENWEKRFDKLKLCKCPNGNFCFDTAFVLKQFISQELKRERIRMGKALREEFWKLQIDLPRNPRTGYIRGVIPWQELNQAIDNYLSRRNLKEREK